MGLELRPTPLPPVGLRTAVRGPGEPTLPPCHALTAQWLTDTVPRPLSRAVATKRTSPTAALLAGWADTIGRNLKESTAWQPRSRLQPRVGGQQGAG